MTSIRSTTLALCVLLVGCGDSAKPDPQGARQDDPLLSEALAEPLMTDPDLATLNLASAATVNPER